MIHTVVITGGIGSGKSVVCRYLAHNGVPVYDADSAAKELYKDVAFVKKMEDRLGVSLIDSEGHFDRIALAKAIFSSDSALKIIENIVHPAVLDDFLRWRKAEEQKEWCGYAGIKPFVVIESAIILQKKIFDGIYDRVVLVDAPVEIRLERAMQRDKSDINSITARMNKQYFDRNTADAVIVNDSDFDDLHKKTDIVFKTLYL